MYFDSQLMKTVAFLACKKPSGYRVRGTVFLVSQSLPNSDKHAVYAVTARHVVDGIAASINDDEPSDGITHIRLNTVRHGFQHVEIKPSAWVTRGGKNIDVAVAPIDLELPGMADDHITIPREMFLSETAIEQEAVGPGDDLYFPGLFKHHAGKRSNVPILRTGAIAAMPGEPIETSKCGPVQAYLAEARSIGGLSGSPVFLDLGFGRAGTAIVARGPDHPRTHLLGLVHGHFGQFGVLDCADEDIDLSKVKKEKEPLNTGIAIIIPISDVASVLDLPELVKQREIEAERYAQIERSAVIAD